MAKAEFLPSYLKLGTAEIKKRAEKARELLSSCRLCPRHCGVDRLKGEKGFCKTGIDAPVSSRNLHHGEEPPISGYRGSGTIFFSNCNLKCVFCQNYPISQMGVGGEVSNRELGDIILTLQRRGAHNINFVTPTHVVHSIISALVYAIESGLKIPLVYNSSGYDSIEELELLDGIVDIYMPDMKYSDDEVAERFSNAPNYLAVNRRAIKEMHKQVGNLVMDEEGIALRGLLIRHLVLPEGLAGTENVLSFIANEVSKDTYISLMSQYFPTNKAFQYPEISRMVNRSEYRKAADILQRLGLENGFIQGF